MLDNALWIVVSAAALLAGAELVVRGAGGLIALRGAASVTAGLLVAAIGTSAPELFLTTRAAVGGHTDLAIGNIIGSNIFNIGLILGVSALICPMRVAPHWLKSDAPLMILVMVALPFVLSNGRVGRWEGAGLVAAALIYLLLNSLAARRSYEESPEEEAGPAPSRTRSLLLMAGGVVLLAVGSRFLLEHALGLAHSTGIPEATIGLTVVAAVTSLPELITSVLAARRGQPDVVIGNVIGSNIFNILGVLGTASVVAPLGGCGLCHSDVFLMIGFSAILIPMLWTGGRLHRLEGGFLVAAYAGYLVFRFTF